MKKNDSIFRRKFKSRRQRRLEAKENGVAFEPMYNGSEPITLKEYEATNLKAKRNKEEKEKVVDESVE